MFDCPSMNKDEEGRNSLVEIWVVHVEMVEEFLEITRVVAVAVGFIRGGGVVAVFISLFVEHVFGDTIRGEIFDDRIFLCLYDSKFRRCGGGESFQFLPGEEHWVGVRAPGVDIDEFKGEGRGLPYLLVLVEVDVEDVIVAAAFKGEVSEMWREFLCKELVDESSYERSLGSESGIRAGTVSLGEAEENTVSHEAAHDEMLVNLVPLLHDNVKTLALFSSLLFSGGGNEIEVITVRIEYFRDDSTGFKCSQHVLEVVHFEPKQPVVGVSRRTPCKLHEDARELINCI